MVCLDEVLRGQYLSPGIVSVFRCNEQSGGPVQCHQPPSKNASQRFNLLQHSCSELFHHLENMMECHALIASVLLVILAAL